MSDGPAVSGELPAGSVAALAAGLRARLAAPAGPALVAIDGWSGSGKTTLAAGLAAALGGVPVVHAEDLVTGWYGLARSVERLAGDVLPALAAGRPARWRSWDWAAGAYGPEQTQPPAPLLVVEGCGAGAAPVRPWLAALVWLEVAPEERAARLRARQDWPTYEPWVQVWARQERRLRTGDDPRPHADVTVAGGARLEWAAAGRPRR